MGFLYIRNDFQLAQPRRKQKSLFKETEGGLLDGGSFKSGIPWVKVKRCRA